MLIDFAVENFKSFDSLARLNMVATREADHRDHCLSLVGINGKTRVNKFAALFGPNAGGKSNLLKALLTMRKMVLECGIRQVGSEEKSDTLLPYSPFSLAKKSCQAPTLFQAIYESGGRCFRYGFTYTAEKIQSEWLYANFGRDEELVFEREELVVTEGKQGAGFATESEKFLNCKSLVLSICNQAKHELAQLASSFWIAISFGSELRPPSLGAWLNGSPFLPAIAAMLQFADTGIADIRAEEQEGPDYIPPMQLKEGDDRFAEIISLTGKLYEAIRQQAPKSPILLFVHSAQDANMTPEECQLHQKDESQGTLRFILLLYILCRAMTKNALVVLDEIENGLHPLLAKGLLEFVTQVQGSSTQVLFTTHCTPLFDSEVLRRDELWLVEKNDGGCSALQCAANYEKDARPDANLMRRFMAGRFGGLPLVRKKILEEGSALASAIIAQVREQQRNAELEQKINADQGIIRTKQQAEESAQIKSNPQTSVKNNSRNKSNQSRGKAHGN
ncbi:MAG: ATP-binding protein [Deltaproteobacteria bacterium]|nr:ATP-binding protein [Deltaproteobacteria bacterium]